MKSKKVYIGILALALFIIICVCASIFYINAKNKNIEVAKFTDSSIDNEDDKEAMKITKDIEETEENTNESKENVVSEEKAENNNEQSLESNLEENKQEVSEETKQDKKESSSNKSITTKKEFTVTPIDKTLYVNVDDLNIRSGPGTEYSRIGGLKKAAEVKVTGKVDKWYRISYNNKVGYVMASYLSTTKPKVEETKKVSEEKQESTSSKPNTDMKVLDSLIVVNSKKNTLRYYVNGKLSRSYSCATGAASTPTPQGKFSVYNKIKNRPYYKENIPGGAPNNPLGKRWIGLQVNGTNGTTYAIHGTNNESSIGKSVSHGCIRMHNSDVESFYNVVSIGTTVIIKNTSQSDKQIAEGYNIYIE